MPESHPAAVLLADLDEAVRYAVGQTLRKSGLRVVEASTGTDALAAVAEVDLVLLADTLADLSAAEVLRRLKASALTRSVPVLVLARANRNGELAAYAEADGVLTQPVQPPELMTAVRALVRLRRAEAALREREERLGQLTENIREVFWISDAASGRVLYVSAAYADLWGRSCQSLYDDPNSWRESVHPDDRERVHGELRRQLRTGGHEAQFRVVRPDGAVRWVGNRSFPVRDAAGNCHRLVGIAEDVTERIRLEEQLRQAQKMEAVGRLAGGVAHDFNNMLTAITGYAELILMDSPDPEDDRRRNAEEIHRAAERAAGLTRQLLAYSRQGTLNPRVLSLNTIVTGMEKMLRRLMKEDVSLVLQLDGLLRRVEVDAGQLEQVILNLAVNACDAMPSGGTLTIATANAELDEAYAWAHADVQPGAYALLTVSDSGSGMTDEVKARLFEPFFTTKEVGKGTGLGLSVVFGIVKANGGHIEVESQPGRGSTFRVYVPQVMESARPEVAAAGPGLPTPGSETILLVEDEEVVRNLTRTVLQRSGYRVLEASDGLEALQLSDRHTGPIHLLVTDVVMPHMNGRDLAQQVTRRRPATKVLYMSGYTGPANELPGADAAFIPKPFAPDALARQVRALLDQA
jgi:PAS domain S-box-containing protein